MGVAKWGGPGKGVGTRVRTSKANWSKPLTWNKKAAANGTRPFVFCASLADVFDNAVDPAWRQDLFDLIRATPNLVWLLLTKRPQNILKMVKAAGGLPPNVALGTTTEDQQRLEMNGAALMAALGALAYIDETPAKFGFLSCEPLLERLDLDVLGPDWGDWITWVIGGGETDQGSARGRISSPGWFRSLLGQSLAAGAIYHHKQNGTYLESQHTLQEGIELYDGARQIYESVVVPGQGAFWRVGKKLAGRRLDCLEHNGRPSC